MTEIDSASSGGPAGTGRVRKVVGWIPAALLALILIVGWTLVLAGGMTGVVAWYLVLQLLAPLIGLLVLLSALIWVIWKRRASRRLAVTVALALAALPPLAWSLGLWPITYPASIERTTPSATVRLPADAPLKVAWGGDNVRVNYHAADPGQRWAYDLVVDPSFTGSTEPSDYGCWGLPVVAPAAGEVVVAEDGHPDETPGRVSNNFMAPTGNHIAIRLPSDTYLVIAHLQEGSVAVSVGDQVEEGQTLGLCGNSGNTSEPHIHIHHQRQNPAAVAGPAEGLPLYFRDHDGPPMPEGGFKVINGTPVPSGPVVSHTGP